MTYSVETKIFSCRGNVNSGASLNVCHNLLLVSENYWNPNLKQHSVYGVFDPTSNK